MGHIGRVLVLLALVALFAPANAAGAKKRSLKVGLSALSQQQVTSARSVPVIVRSRRPGRVRLILLARETGPRTAKWHRIAKRRVVRFRKRGRKRARIKLTAWGRTQLSRCGGRRLRVVALRGASRRTARHSRLMKIDRGACVRRASANITTRNANRCDFLDESHCLHPWPNDHFTRGDRSTPTRKRLALHPQSMPANTAGVRINPTDQNRADGYSPGNLVVTHVPGMNNKEAFRRTRPVVVEDLGRYDDANQPVVVINARTRKRHLVWAEMDVNAAKPEDANLIIRPGVNWDEGERYIVALRRLRNKDGRVIDAQPAFRAYRDNLSTTDRPVEQRRAHMEDIFGRLGRAGIKRDDLYLAWDFTVASEKSLSGRQLQIRNDAFARLGDRNLGDLRVEGNSPTYVVTQVENLAPCGSDGCQDGEDDNLGRRVTGRMVVPCYLDVPGCPPGARFAYSGANDDTPDPVPANTMLAEFICNIPRRQLAGTAAPARPSLYGHGLLGSADEVGAGNVKAMGQEHNFVFCATPWIGMSQEDIPNVATILLDLSNFSSLADRVQQSMVNFMYLGRAMIHPQGFNTHPAFQVGVPPKGTIDTRRLFYDGNSQGGIIGGSLAAVAPDFEHAVLGVPAMNYSTLLRRSVDFDTYAQLMYRTYPDEGERPLVLSQIQLLWDRAEANGYAHHMTDDPLPNTPRHKVLMHPAFADHQVTNIAADVEARTIGAATHNPVLDPGRSFERQPLYGIQRFAAFPYSGSAIIYFDTGPFTPANPEGARTHPTDEVPPRPPAYGEDPHGDPRASRHGRVQKSEFLRIGGRVVDVCGGKPCYAGDWRGP
jgi:hypothetical protein